MAASQATCDIHNEAVSGTRCTYWPDKISALLTKDQPDLVTFFCGTNDDPSTAASRDQIGWSWRYTVEAIHTFRPTDPIKIAPAFIQYSDPLIAPQWLQDNEPQTNDVIYQNWILYQPAGWFVGTPDLQKIPATADYLDDGGIHPDNPGAEATLFDAVTSGKGYRTMGRIVYDAIAPAMDWPKTIEPSLCGMYGHRRGYPRPTGYTLCR
jgi:lysophospholipase L1-like esterase